jgi:hypothetical protein
MRHRFLPYLASFALLTAALAANCGAAPGVARMGTEELKGLLGNPAVVVVDVRTGGDWDGSKTKIQGAVRENPDAPGSWAGKYGKDKTLVLYCA